MKKLTKISCLLLLSCLLLIGNINAKSSDVIDDGYTIENYTVEMVVHKNGKIDIKETIDTFFKVPRHGIYRSIPQIYTMDFGINDSGMPTRYNWPITNVSLNEAYEPDNYGDNLRLKIGNKKELVVENKKYELSYTVNSSDLGIKDKQMLYYNILGGFTTLIEKSSFSIRFEEDVYEYVNDAKLYLDGSNEANINMNYDRSTYTLSGKYNKPIYAENYLTIKMDLMNDYFQYDSPGKIINGNDYSPIAAAISIGSLLIIGFIFIKFGKDDPITPVVMFDAPTDLDSAGIGFVLDGVVDNKDITSLFIYWANAGLLAIEDKNENDSETNTTLIKLKEIDPNVNEYQAHLFKALFYSSDRVTLDELKKDNFGLKINENKHSCTNYFKKNPNKVFYSASYGFQFLAIVLAALCPAITAFSATMFFLGGETSSALVACVAMVAFMVAYLPFIFVIRRKFALPKMTYYSAILGIVILNALLAMIMLYILNISYLVNVYTIISLICGFIGSIIAGHMDKRTPKGTEWLNQIIGLKSFIELAEKDRLELLVNENPKVFYNILPYAYVLGVSDVWAKKFENIAIIAPDWYYGNSYSAFNSYIFFMSFNNTMHHLNNTSSYIPAPNSSGTGGFGGGGGGFSGGGFGGGGGGSW